MSVGQLKWAIKPKAGRKDEYSHLKQSYLRTRFIAYFESKLFTKNFEKRIPVLEIENLTRRVNDEIGRVNARQGACSTAQVAAPIQSLISPCKQGRNKSMWHMTNVGTRAKNAGSEFGRREGMMIGLCIRLARQQQR